MNDDFQSWPARKTELVQAAISLVAEEGLDRSTTARIAEKAGVGEGTIYRHFNNKKQLIDIAAEYTAELTFATARKNYRPESSVHGQYVQFCSDYLTSGTSFIEHYRFLEQYLNSPMGIEYRRRTLAQLAVDPDIKPLLYPLNRIISQAQQQEIVKDLPLQLLIALTMGPLTFILKHSAQGFLQLTPYYIDEIAKSCWNSIRR